MKHALRLLAALLLAAPVGAQTIEQAEAELKAAKEAAQRAKDQQAAREAETRRAAEAARLAQALRKGTLILQSDADCSLSIDGNAQGELTANQPKSLEVAPGEQLIRCAATEDPETAVELIKAAAGGSKQVVKLELVALIKPKLDTSKAGTVFRDKLKDGREGPEMVVIPAGSFTMGSPESEPDRGADEGPQHRVTLKAFAMGKTEVTVAQFRQFVDATRYVSEAERNAGGTQGCFKELNFRNVASADWKSPGFAQVDSNPAVCLSANDAEAFISWLSTETGATYRLPTEAQQEYSIRAGADSHFPWGDDVDSACLHGNVLDRSGGQELPGGADCSDGYRFTTSVANYRVNAFGLYDTIGNVSEWSADCYSKDYTGAPLEDSQSRHESCFHNVFRGAAWSDSHSKLRAADRSSASPDDRSDKVGFRVVREL